MAGCWGVKVVVCWQTPVSDTVARRFEKRFYELLCKEPGQHANAFRNVCLEMSGALSQTRPCLLQASGGQRGQPAKEIWNGE
ncbi:MAG: hypothetical protein ACPIOQ_76225, partial [Promethearchaeia archaeon]